MSEWSDKWNALPYDIRHIGSMVEAEMRIQQLTMEKKRLKARYDKSVEEVNSHIRNLESYIKKA